MAEDWLSETVNRIASENRNALSLGINSGEYLYKLKRSIHEARKAAHRREVSIGDLDDRIEILLHSSPGFGKMFDTTGTTIEDVLLRLPDPIVDNRPLGIRNVFPILIGLALLVPVATGPWYWRTGGAVGFALVALICLLAALAPPRFLQATVGLVAVLAILTFFAAFVLDERLGGSAANGKIEDDMHYLGSHGHYSPVSEKTFTRMAYLDAAILALWPSMFAGAALVRSRVRPTGEIRPNNPVPAGRQPPLRSGRRR